VPLLCLSLFSSQNAKQSSACLMHKTFHYFFCMSKKENYLLFGRWHSSFVFLCGYPLNLLLCVYEEPDKAKISLHHGEHDADNIHQSREDPIDQKNKLTHSRLIQHCLFAKSCYRLGTIPCTIPSFKLELRIQEPCCKMWQRVKNESRLYQLDINVRACFNIFGHT
jgi:hypothetical protein